MSAYWRAIDASIKFNICRREVYLAKKLASECIAAEAIKSEGVRSASSKDLESIPPEDPMTDFFRRRRYTDNDAQWHICDRRRSGVYHGESRMEVREDMSRGRFLLPRLKNRY